MCFGPKQRHLCNFLVLKSTVIKGVDTMELINAKHGTHCGMYHGMLRETKSICYSSGLENEMYPDSPPLIADETFLVWNHR